MTPPSPTSVNICPNVFCFWLSEPDQYLKNMNSIYCPSCGQPLTYQRRLPVASRRFPLSGLFHKASWLLIVANGQILIGLYNKYNTLAAVLAAQQLGIDEVTIRDTIANFQAAFGRQRS